MITPEDREAGLPITALLQLGRLGGAAPRPLTGAAGSLTGGLSRLGWKIIPVPVFIAAGEAWRSAGGAGNPAHIDFEHSREWLIVPPEESAIRAVKVEGKVRAIREACRLAAGEGGEDAAAPLE